MSVMFTQHAVDRMKKGTSMTDVAQLLETVERLAADPSVLAKSAHAIVPSRGSREKTYIVRSGDMRAVVTVDPKKPDEVLVISIYQADDDSGAQDHAQGEAAGA